MLPIDLKEEEIKIAIMDYLTDKGNNEYKHHENEKTFASMRTYLSDGTIERLQLDIQQQKELYFHK